MNLNPQRVFEAEQRLADLLGPELAQVTQAIHASLDDHPFLIQLPDAETIDEPLENLASLVARSANAYVRAARFAGMARAEAKRARGLYERKYKKLRVQGKNDKERDAHAMTACEVEHSAMITAEAIAEIAESMEHGARVASESARKIFDKAQAMYIGTQRESHGRLRDVDFSPY